MVVPEGLGERGRALWTALCVNVEPAGAMGVLILEACRTADRLERLDGFLRGDETSWFEFGDVDYDGTVEVVISAPLTEARQQQMALKQLLQTIGLDQKPASKGAKSDDLAARRAARVSAAKSSDAT